MKENIFKEIYHVQSRLCKRGSRETLLAKNSNTDELVIIKLFGFGSDAAWSEFELFEREAQTLKNIDHPAIPKYLDYFEIDLPQYRGFALVQEYIAAPSLETSLAQGRNFSELEIEQIAKAMLDILIYLHQKQPSIIHRDIKPSNILLSNRSGNNVGRVYLIDFGAVKNVASIEGGTITVVGTYGYMPPEQFGGRTNPASDLYSLGATLIYLTTGRHPTDLPSKDGRIVFEGLVDLNLSLKRWLRKMTEPSCDLRFNSATEALQALQQPIVLDKDSEIVKQPAYSKIKLRKTPDKIEIFIPPKGFTPEIIFLIAFAIAWNSFLVLWTGGAVFMTPFPINIFFALFSIPFWTVGLSMIGGILFALFGSIRLKITTEKISLTYECLHLKYQKPKPTSRHKIEAIDRTKVSYDGRIKKDDSSVTVWADRQPYRMIGSTSNNSKTRHLRANHLSAMELDWVSQEISQWLNLPVTEAKTSTHDV